MSERSPAMDRTALIIIDHVHCHLGSLHGFLAEVKRSHEVIGG